MTNSMDGLTTSEAKALLRRYGENELRRQAIRGFWTSLWANAHEPMVLLLLVCGAVYFSFGDIKEALILTGSVAVVIGITVFQERKTERALESLRDLSAPRANVVRDGRPMRIAARDVVPGDLLLLEEGDRIPADGVLLGGAELRADESLLTGESLPVAKGPGAWVYAHTLVVRGRGRARVRATGATTEVGKIGHALETVTPGESPLRGEIRGLVRRLAGIALVVCLGTVFWLGLLRTQWQEGLLAGLTLAMSLLPEEFPVVLTVFFALGAYRIARRHVLTRRLPAIEALGSATVLCTDKTGTLTENRMQVTHYLAAADGIVREAQGAETPQSRELALAAALACPSPSFDPVDQAALAFGASVLDKTASRLRVVREFPLSSERPMLGEVYEDDRGLWAALKGAPEAVVRLCHWPAGERTRLTKMMAPLAAGGLRLIAVAQARLPAGRPPECLEDIPFRYLGLLGMSDPLRKGVREAVQECRSAGIQVLMMTGDYSETAAAVAAQAGLHARACMTGDAFAAMDDAALQAAFPRMEVYARFKPLQKLRLVQLLRHADAIVAMTGDGVNDAPALKAAHIGIAMGGRGTDVAREAADLVVLDDNFVSIVGAIRLGRRIYDNLQKSLSYLISVHVPIAGMALTPLIMHWPLFFTPIHIVFLELIIDPTCSLVFEGELEDADVMRRPPRPSNARLMDRSAFVRSLLDGCLVWGVTAVVFGLGLHLGAGDLDARALGFVTLVFGNLMLILANRTHRRNFWRAVFTSNPVWWLVASSTVVLLVSALYVPALQALFKFSYLHAPDLALAAAAQVVLVVALRLVRYLRVWDDVRKPLARLPGNP